MSIYSYKLAHVQVIINCPYSIAHLCTSEATLAYNLGAQHFDDIMSYNSLKTIGVANLEWLTLNSITYAAKFEL